MRHVGAAAARAVRLSAATVGNQRAAVRGVGRGGVELTLRKRHLTQRCGSLPAQISAVSAHSRRFCAGVQLLQKRPPHGFWRKPSRVPQPSLPASQEWRYTLVTNEDTNTPGGPRVPTAKTTQTIRPGGRSAHHRRRRPALSNNPGAVHRQRGSRLASGVALGTRPRREFGVQIQHHVARSSP